MTQNLPLNLYEWIDYIKQPISLPCFKLILASGSIYILLLVVKILTYEYVAFLVLFLF